MSRIIGTNCVARSQISYILAMTLLKLDPQQVIRSVK